MEINNIWVVSLESTDGCESECTATEILAVFNKREDAESWSEEYWKTLNKKSYYNPRIEIEMYPLNPTI